MFTRAKILKLTRAKVLVLTLLTVLIPLVVMILNGGRYTYRAECVLIGTIILGLIAARRVPEYDQDFMLILGCRVRDDGAPTPIICFPAGCRRRGSWWRASP